MNTLTKELREQWDKITGPGLYTVEGDAAYQYVCYLIKWMVIDRADPKTILLIGTLDERKRFLKAMIEEGALEVGEIEPWFFFRNDYVPDGRDEDDLWPRSLASEVDTEDFCDFIRHSRAKGYFPVGAVVLLGEEDQLKYVDKILKIPVWHGSTLEKHIELPVYNVSSLECEYSEFSKPCNSVSPSGLKRTIEMVRADEIETKNIEWLVPDFVPMYAPTVFSGEMDTRKSTLALDIAATGSCLQPWFMQTESEKEEVMVDGKKWRVPIMRKPFLTLFAGAEDDYARTVVPRYLAAGGNPDCFYCLKLDVKNEKNTADGLQVWETPLSLDEHIELLREQIRSLNNTREWPVGLLICDPIISFFGNKNYNNPQDARDIMRHLKDLCEQEHITIINICHFNKTQGLTAKQKTAGSKALVEAHRMGWAFDLEEDDPSTTLIAPIKKNLLKEARSYKITTVDCDSLGVIKFVGYSTKTADDRIDEKESKDRGNRKELKKAILDVLKDGPMSAGQVCNQLQDMGSVSSIGRAARSLEEEGKMLKTGNNRKNMTWQLATEVEQTPMFQGAATNE